MTEIQKNTVKPWADPNAEPFVQIKNVTKKFRTFSAVRDLLVVVSRYADAKLRTRV